MCMCGMYACVYVHVLVFVFTIPPLLETGSGAVSERLVFVIWLIWCRDVSW